MGYVDIINTKSSRDRRLYLSEELTSYLARYDKAVSVRFPKREYFFPSAKGGICSSDSISFNFKKIWISAGLKRDGKVKPRAYDFRHHFACANNYEVVARGQRYPCNASISNAIHGTCIIGKYLLLPPSYT